MKRYKSWCDWRWVVVGTLTFALALILLVPENVHARCCMRNPNECDNASAEGCAAGGDPGTFFPDPCICVTNEGCQLLNGGSCVGLPTSTPGGPTDTPTPTPGAAGATKPAPTMSPLALLVLGGALVSAGILYLRKGRRGTEPS